VLLLAYAFLAGMIAWTLGRRGEPWVLRLSEPGQQRVRLAAGMLDTAVGAIGIAVLGLQLGDHAHMLGLELTRFPGHPESWRQGRPREVRDGTQLPSRVPP